MAKANFCGNPAKIKVVGLGSSGSSTVTRIIREEIRGVEFITMNTDRRALTISEAPIRIQLGRTLTMGSGTGGDPIIGRKAAEESRSEITDAISGADIVFITCGMGGGTGTGAAPLVAEIARNNGALTIAVVSKPFTFEGRHRQEAAEKGIAALLGKIDTAIIVPNDRLLNARNRKIGVDEAFQSADHILKQGILAIVEVLNTPGVINLDFADIKAILKDSGSALMSIGVGHGPNCAVEAVQCALASPLMDISPASATRVLFNIVGNDNLTLHEINEAAKLIRRVAAPEANIIFGVALDPGINADEIKITLIATGFIAGNRLAVAEQQKRKPAITGE